MYMCMGTLGGQKKRVLGSLKLQLQATVYMQAAGAVGK